jgi:transposase
MNCTTLGIDVAKQVFQLHGVDERGHVVVLKRVSRSKLRATVAQLPSVSTPALGVLARRRRRCAR